MRGMFCTWAGECGTEEDRPGQGLGGLPVSQTESPSSTVTA